MNGDRAHGVPMRFDLFENMSSDETTALLTKFLSDEPENLQRLCEAASVAGVCCDFSTVSIPDFVKYVMQNLTTRRTAPEENVPEWIRASEDYQKGLYEFDERSCDLLATAAFYVGEAFCRSFTGLSWGTGDVETAFGNMPVVQGFEGGREFPPMLVLENLIRRIIEEPGCDSAIHVAVDSWSSMADNSP